MKEKNNSGMSLKCKLLLWETVLREWKRQAIDGEKIFAKCVSDMGLVNNNSWVNNAGKKQNKQKTAAHYWQ